MPPAGPDAWLLNRGRTAVFQQGGTRVKLTLSGRGGESGRGGRHERLAWLAASAAARLADLDQP